MPNPNTIRTEVYAGKQAARAALARMEAAGFETVFFGPCEFASWFDAVSAPEIRVAAFDRIDREIWVLIGKS